MPQMRTVVIRLYPNRTQEKALLNALGRCCFLYNHLLETCKKAYEDGQKHPSEFDLNKHIVDFRGMLLPVLVCLLACFEEMVVQETAASEHIQ